MKAGIAIFYRNAGGTTSPATCSAVVGTGESTYKVLDVVSGGVTYAAVPYVTDAAHGAACWSLEPVASIWDTEPDALDKL